MKQFNYGKDLLLFNVLFFSRLIENFLSLKNLIETSNFPFGNFWAEYDVISAIATPPFGGSLNRSY